VMDSPFDLMALSPEIFEDAQDLPPYTPPFSPGPTSPHSPEDLGIDDQLPPLFLLQDPPSSPQDPFPMFQNPVSNSTDDSNAIRDPNSTLSDFSLPSSPTPTEIIDELIPISHPIHDPVISNITTQATLPLITLKLTKLQLPSVSLPLIKKPPIPTLPVPIKVTPQLVKPKPNSVPVSNPVPLMSLDVGLPPPVKLRKRPFSFNNAHHPSLFQNYSYPQPPFLITLTLQFRFRIIATLHNLFQIVFTHRMLFLIIILLQILTHPY
ncbi:unnamed protein product, partial [Allacma fusca]